MPEIGPFETQRDVISPIISELEMVGLEGAREIGRGGFGVVFRCTQVLLDRVVAVKILTETLGKDSVERFSREQQAMGRLTGHPNIVNVLEAGTTKNGRPYIVMQYHARGSLEDRIRKAGAVPLKVALGVGVKMAGALEGAHRLGILHRDVKPGNILFTDYGEPALTDFGIAHVSGGFETATGLVTGSPAFTAPEILSGEPPSVAADIYSLGATLFCAVSGHAAFQRRSGEEVVAQFLRITTQPVPDLRELGLSEGVARVVERAMATDPRRRPLSAGDFGEALRNLQIRNGFPVDRMAFVGNGTDQQPENRESARNAPIFAKGGEGLATPVSSPAAGSLPLELTSFVGRRRELVDLKSKVLQSRLVTLTGIGGVGKTRLAVHVSTELKKRFTDGITLVELSELWDTSLLMDLVATVLGVRDRTSTQIETQLTEYLATRRLLLVIDNCEHMVSEVAALVEMFLRTCPELHILTTSREPLGIDGEVVMRITPLTIPATECEETLRSVSRYDALTLFADRAAAALSGFELNGKNYRTVCKICQRLDGLPLPIELAAARLRSMSIEQISERLTDRFKLLTLGRRNAPSRQQTSKLCMDWSYDLLTDSEQKLWKCLSVFVGGFELDAVEAVSQDEDSDALLDRLASLVDKSILIREETGTVVRFRMLETLHDYGREKGESSEEFVTAAHSHREWCRDIVLQAEIEWISPRQLEWIARLGRELPNFREAMGNSMLGEEPNSGALQIAGALFPFWLARGLFSEGRYWLDHLLQTNPRIPSIARINALCADSVLASIQGDLEIAATLIAEGKELSDYVDDRTSRARIAHGAGSLALFQGDTALACERLRAALEMIGSDGDHSLRVWTLNSLGIAYESNGETERAISCYEETLAITQLRGESVYRSSALRSMGVAVWRQGDLTRASSLIERALRLTRTIDEPLTAATCLEALAWIADSDAEHRRAAILMGASERLVSTVNSSIVLFPSLLSYRSQCEQHTLRALGERAYLTALRQGRAMSSLEATSFALRERSSAPMKNSSTHLSKRERQVADLVAQGMTNKSIAAHLVISLRTVQGHVEHILTKLDFNSRSQIAAWVVEQRHPDPETLSAPLGP